MKTKRIKSIFNAMFNGLPNPMFPTVLGYFQHGDSLVELAVAEREKAGLYAPWSLARAVGIEMGIGTLCCTVLRQIGQYSTERGQSFHIDGMEERIGECMHGGAEEREKALQRLIGIAVRRMDGEE